VIFAPRALERRRSELVARSTLLRSEVAAVGVPLQARLAPVDRVVSAARAHPVATGLAVAGAVFLMGRSLPSLARALRWYLLLTRF